MYFSAKLESSFYFSATWNVNCALINCYGDLILVLMSIRQYGTPHCIFYSAEQDTCVKKENEGNDIRRGDGSI